MNEALQSGAALLWIETDISGCPRQGMSTPRMLDAANTVPAVMRAIPVRRRRRQKELNYENP